MGMYIRIRHHRLKITRYQPQIARYTMIKHKQEKVNKQRTRVLRTSRRRLKTDGLNSLAYQLITREMVPLYTNVSVILNRTGYVEESSKTKTRISEEMKQRIRSIKERRQHKHP